MPTVDNKVVQMTFDNKQFERGVKESLHSLDELKKALDLDKSAQSLENLEKIASSFDISGIAKGIDNIADKFTLLGNIGQEIFHRISKTAVDAMENVVHTVTAMPQAGLSKYEQRNKAVQMIQSAMPEKSLADIEAVLDKLNEYTDLTSYDFSQMAQSIGKFTSAGIDLEVAERAMEGIANETASAGGEIAQANIAMYNFSQALAAGSVKLLDWHSIENQNLATKEFKEQIIETAYELGTLRKVQDKVGQSAKGTTVTYENFAQTLSEGWFTSDVLIKVLEKYADRESEVGKKGFEAAKIAITLTQAFEAVKDAISTKWMKSFQYIFGDLEEAGKLFTRVSDALINFTDKIGNFRNSILEGWHTGGENGISGYTMAIEAMSNAWSVLMGFAEAARQALVSVFGEIDATPFIGATQGIRDFTQGLKDFFGYSEETVTKHKKIWQVSDGIEEWTSFIQKGMRGDEVKVLQERLMGLDNTLISLDKHGADGIFGPETEAALKAFQKSVGIAETGIYDQSTRDALAKAMFPKGIRKAIREEYEVPIKHVGSGLELLRKALTGVFSVAKAGMGVIKLGLTVVGKVASLFAPIGTGLLSLLGGLGDLTTYVVDFVTSLISSESAMSAIDKFLTPFSATLSFIGGIIYSLGDGISKIVAIARQATNYDELGRLLSLNPEDNKNAIAIYNIISKIRDVGKQVWPVVVSMTESIKSFFGSVKAFIGEKLASGMNTISTFFTNLWTRAKEGNYLEKALNGVAIVLKVILGIVGGVGFGLYNIGKAAIDGAVALFDFVKNSEFLNTALASIQKFFEPVGEFFSSIWNSLTNLGGLLPSFKSFSSFWSAFIEEMESNPIGQKFVPALTKLKSVIGGPIAKIKEFTSVLAPAFKILTAKNRKLALTEFLNDPKNKERASAVVKFLTKIGNIMEKIRPIINSIRQTVGNVFGKLSPAIKEFGSSVWGAITNFFGGDGTSATDKVKNKFSEIFDKLKEIWDKFKNWVSTVVTNSPFLSNLVEFGKLIGQSVKDFFGMDTSDMGTPGEKLMKRLHAFDPVINWIKDKIAVIKGVFTGEEGLVGKIKQFFAPNEGGIFSSISSGIKNLGGVFSDIDLSDIWDGIKTGLNMAFLAIIVKAISRFSKTLAVLTGAANPKKDTGKTVLEIAISIGIIAGALWLLAKTPAKKALAGVGVMTIALAVVTGAMVALKKWADVGDVGKGLLAIAASVALVLVALVGAMEIIKNYGLKRIALGLVMVGGILVALTFVARKINETGKQGGSIGGAATIVALCFGILLVVRAISKIATLFSKADISPHVWPAFGMIEVLIATLGVIAYKLNKAGSFGSSVGGAAVIVGICYSIGLLVSSVGKVSKMLKKDSGNTWGAFAMIEVMLILLGAIAVLLNKFSTENTSLLGTATSLGSIIVLGKVMNSIAETMAESIQKIANVDTDKMVAFMVGVDTAIGVLAGVVMVFANMPKTGIVGILSGSVGIVAIMTAIGAGVGIAASFAADAMKKLASAMYIVGSNLSDFSTFMSVVNTDAINNGITCMTDTVLPFMLNLVANSSVVATAHEVSQEIVRFGADLKLFAGNVETVTPAVGQSIKQLALDLQDTVNTINGIQGVAEAQDVLNNLGAAFGLYYGNLKMAATGQDGESVDVEGSFDTAKANEAFQALADLTLNDETLEKIKSYATGGEHDLNGFAGGIQNLGVALKNYGESISGLDAGQVGTANDILDKVSDIEEHLSWTKITDFGILSGKDDTITGFGEDIVILGEALAAYGESVAGLTARKIIMANLVLDKVADISTILPKTNGLMQFLEGSQDLGQFASNMSNLGDGMAQYANKVSEAKFDNVEVSIKPVEAIARVQRTLKNSGGISELINGASSLSSLGSGLASLGTELVNFANSGIGGLTDDDFNKMTQAIDPIQALATAQSKLQGQGLITDFFNGSKSLEILGSGLVGFGDKLLAFQTKINEYNPEDTKTKAALDTLYKVAEIQNEFGQDPNDKKALESVGQSFVKFFEQLASIMEIQNGSSLADDATTAVGVLLHSIADQISEDGQPVDAMATMLTNVVNKMEEYEDSFQTVGEQMDQGLAVGLYKGQSNAITAAAFVAASTLEKAKSVLGIASPSKEFAWIGNMIGAGLMNGISEYSGKVEEASNGTVSKVIDSAKAGIKSYMQLFSEGIDDSPVITPVIDLSEISSGVSAMGTMLDNGTISTGLNLAKGVASGNSGIIINENANDNHEVVEAINMLNNQVNGMASMLSNLRVVMDTGALVGQIAGPMDRRLGQLGTLNYRRG